MTDPRRQSSYHRARSVSNAARSRRLWTMRLCTFTWRRHLRKNTIKRALQYVRWLKTMKLAGSILTNIHIPSPHRRQRHQSHSDAVEITLKKLASLASIRLRRVILAPNRKVTSRQYGKRGIFVCGDVRIQDGDAVDLVKLGGGPLSCVFFFVLSIAALALVYVVIMYMYRATVLFWCSVLCDILVLFMYETCKWPWGIAPIRFNNVSLCPSIFIANIPGLLRPRLLTPGLMLASWMLYSHYPTLPIYSAMWNYF